MKLQLCLYFACEKLDTEEVSDEEFHAVADAHMTRVIKWPTCPTAGQSFFLYGEEFEITRVKHNFDKGFIEVDCDVGIFDGIAVFRAGKESDWEIIDCKGGFQDFMRGKLKEIEQKVAKATKRMKRSRK